MTANSAIAATSAPLRTAPAFTVSRHKTGCARLAMGCNPSGMSENAGKFIAPDGSYVKARDGLHIVCRRMKV
ncbi:hypothetical protein QE363_000353 [Sphingomonas sp. SORGH_AS870]|uniref:hypothetical protein n=1 Tax=Sphingomonas sp. SORGH_AS_0870 TaxID=3041801 RepID=UPI002866D3CC|nr:hypothetical protein [Sphingomonas sp. SORGH_AS_0870]MDR6144560.1 hypothetical protein [Sphingomonas sp. SORGH_AS_0870]